MGFEYFGILCKLLPRNIELTLLELVFCVYLTYNCVELLLLNFIVELLAKIHSSCDIRLGQKAFF